MGEKTRSKLNKTKQRRREISDYGYAEEGLRLFMQVVETVPDGVQIVDMDGYIIYSNRAVEEIYGFSNEELKGKHVNEMNADPVFAGKVILPCIKETGRWVGELMVTHKDGRVFPVWLTTSMVKNNKSEPIAMIGIIRDITERKGLEEELREKERFLESIFASIQDGIGIIDKDMNIIRVNPTAERWYSHAAPFVGRKCYEAYHGRSERCEKCPACKTLETCESAYEVVPKHGQDGEEVGWLEIYSFPMIDTATRQMNGVIEYVRDITDRKRAEEALKAAIVNAEMEKNKSEAIIDAIGDGIIIQDTDYEIIYQNQIQNKLHGNHVGEYCYKAYEGRDTICEDCPVELTFMDGEIHRAERSVLTDDGKLHFELTGSPLRDSTGKIIAGVKVVRNITDQKRVEESIMKYSKELEESNRMMELFTDIMHHDLLNPLNVVNGYVELLQESEKDPQKNSYLGTIERNLNKGIELIESATKFSRLKSLESIEFEELDLKDIIEQVIEALVPLAYRAGIIIENNTKSMPARANKIIEEVFANLISNAVKYASSGRKIIVNSYGKGSFWRIKVIDFGEGITDADKTMIFERFRRTEKKGIKGSGLGLAIARKIVELHKGRIWVEDNPEGGAIFVVELPKS